MRKARYALSPSTECPGVTREPYAISPIGLRLAPVGDRALFDQVRTEAAIPAGVLSVDKASVTFVNTANGSNHRNRRDRRRPLGTYVHRSAGIVLQFQAFRFRGINGREPRSRPPAFRVNGGVLRFGGYDRSRILPRFPSCPGARTEFSLSGDPPARGGTAIFRLRDVPI